MLQLKPSETSLEFWRMLPPRPAFRQPCEAKAASCPPSISNSCPPFDAYTHNTAIVTNRIISYKPQNLHPTYIMDQAKDLLEMPREFVKDGRQFLTRCSKRTSIPFLPSQADNCGW